MRKIIKRVLAFTVLVSLLTSCSEETIQDDWNLNSEASSALNSTTIQAEDYDTQSGIQLAGSGNWKVGYVNHGDWVSYEDFDFSGANSISIQAASKRSGGTIEVRAGGVNGDLLGTVYVSNTGGWDNMDTFTADINDNSNNSDLYLVFKGGSGYLLDLDSFTFSGTNTNTSSSYVSIPAKIQAEDFSDATEGRTQTKTSNNDGSQVTNVGWIDNGESLFYDINVPSSGEYTIDFRLSSLSAGSKFNILKNGSILGSVSAPATGNWYTWDNANETVQLSSGNQTIEIKATGSGWNIDWLEFNEAGDNPVTIDPPTGGGDNISAILNGDMWKITMPYDQNGNDSGNVSDPNDRNRNAYEYYDLNQASADYSDNLYVSGGEVFFVSHCGGATTSGSIYPRCELRQLDGNGSDDLVSFNTDQYLDVTVRAVQTPVEKPEVCMVQLKGSSSNEIIRVDFTKDSQGLHLTENESTTLDDVIDYELGDRLRVRITLDSEEVRLQLNNLENGDTYDKTWAHNDDEGYFKVGSYVQSAITFCEEKNKSESECTDDDRDAVGIVAVSNFNYSGINY